MPDPELSKAALLRALLPQLLAVSVTFLLTGSAFAALPLFVARDLGLGPAMIGLLAGLSFLFAIVTRLWAGGFSDRKGPKLALIAALALAMSAGAFSLAAALLQGAGALAVAALIVGRLLLGGAEGIVMVAGQTWALAVAGPARSGLVIGWVGTAMFAAMAIGAPMGGTLYALGGFGAVGLATILAPVPVLMLVLRLKGRQAATGATIVIRDVIRRIARHCIAMALVGIGYGAIVSFGVLHFEARGWMPTWAGLTGFSIALVAARIFAGSAPDRFGGVLTAQVSLVVMIAGFGLLALAPGAGAGIAGATIAGFGYALVYPALGREMLRNIPDRNRGSAMALYASSISLTLAVGGPLMGGLATIWDTGAVFLFAGAMALAAMALVALFPRSV